MQRQCSVRSGHRLSDGMPVPDDIRKSENMKPTKYNPARLLFRRQFVLGPRFAEGFLTWNRLELTPLLRLAVHPDLPTCTARRGKRSIALLGYILDPDDPGATDADIVNRLL